MSELTTAGHWQYAHKCVVRSASDSECVVSCARDSECVVSSTRDSECVVSSAGDSECTASSVDRMASSRACAASSTSTRACAASSTSTRECKMSSLVPSAVALDSALGGRTPISAPLQAQCSALRPCDRSLMVLCNHYTHHHKLMTNSCTLFQTPHLVFKLINICSNLCCKVSVDIQYIFDKLKDIIYDQRQFSLLYSFFHGVFNLNQMLPAEYHIQAKKMLVKTSFISSVISNQTGILHSIFPLRVIIADTKLLLKSVPLPTIFYKSFPLDALPYNISTCCTSDRTSGVTKRSDLLLPKNVDRNSLKTLSNCKIFPPKTSKSSITRQSSETYNPHNIEPWKEATEIAQHTRCRRGSRSRDARQSRLFPAGWARLARSTRWACLARSVRNKLADSSLALIIFLMLCSICSAAASGIRGEY